MMQDLATSARGVTPLKIENCQLQEFAIQSNQIQYPEIMKRYEDTVTEIYFHVVLTKGNKQNTRSYLKCSISKHTSAFPNDRANKLLFI